MTVELRIDPNALMALFPEGTEARLNLQQSVLAEVAKRMFKGLVDQELLNVIGPIVQKTKDQLIAEYATKTTNWYSRPELTENLKHRIKEEVTTLINHSLNECIKSSLIIPEEVLERTVRVAKNNMLQVLRERINKSYDEAFKERIAEINSQLTPKE